MAAMQHAGNIVRARTRAEREVAAHHLDACVSGWDKDLKLAEVLKRQAFVHSGKGKRRATDKEVALVLRAVARVRSR